MALRALTPKTVTSPTTLPKEIPIPDRAMANTLPMRLKGRLAMTSPLLTGQCRQTKRIRRINPSAMPEYRVSSVRAWASASAAPVNSRKTFAGNWTCWAIACCACWTTPESEPWLTLNVTLTRRCPPSCSML